MEHKRIDVNPGIMFGKPVIKGTRITVEHILRKLAGGMTADEIIKDHPHLKPEGPARALLKIASENPKAVVKSLSA